MEDCMFTHRKCGGALVLDLSGSFKLISPSISIGNGSLVVGVTELREGSDKTSPAFLCTKCGENVEDIEKDVLALCMICQEYHPVSEMKSSRQLANLCATCLSYAKEEKTPVPEKLTRTLKYLNFKGSEMKFYKLLDILKKPVNIS